MPAPIIDNMDGKPDWVKKRTVNISPEEVKVTRQQYCAATELIDNQIGNMLRALEERGMLENTYIIYSSDHGEMLGDHGLYTKSLAYEASLRVPLIVAGPGIEGNRVSHELVELIDINPTICDLVGVPVLENIDGQSIGPVVRGETETHRSETVSRLGSFTCIRTQTHKLIENRDGFIELYDLQNDPDELDNIADDNPQLVEELTSVMNRRYGPSLV